MERLTGFSSEHTAAEHLAAPTVMNLEQAANYLRISKAHLSNVINGRVYGVRPVRFFRLGRRVLIKREWIDAWLEGAAQTAPPGC